MGARTRGGQRVVACLQRTEVGVEPRGPLAEQAPVGLVPGDRRDPVAVADPLGVLGDDPLPRGRRQHGPPARAVGDTVRDAAARRRGNADRGGRDHRRRRVGCSRVRRDGVQQRGQLRVERTGRAQHLLDPVHDLGPHGGPCAGARRRTGSGNGRCIGDGIGDGIGDDSVRRDREPVPVGQLLGGGQAGVQPGHRVRGRCESGPHGGGPGGQAVHLPRDALVLGPRGVRGRAPPGARRAGPRQGTVDLDEQPHGVVEPHDGHRQPGRRPPPHLRQHDRRHRGHPPLTAATAPPPVSSPRRPRRHGSPASAVTAPRSAAP